MVRVCISTVMCTGVCLLLVMTSLPIGWSQHQSSSPSFVHVVPVPHVPPNPKVQLVDYPVELLAPVLGTKFRGTVSQNKLTCFANRDYPSPTFLESFLCVSFLFGSSAGSAGGGTSWAPRVPQCDTLWGSRSVAIEVNGSVEFFKVSKLPQETYSGFAYQHQYQYHSNQNDEAGTGSDTDLDALALSLSASTGMGTPDPSRTLVAARWTELSSLSPGTTQHDTKQVPAEPLFLCTRSSDWTGEDSSFKITFRSGFLRANDVEFSKRRLFMHAVLILIVSSAWLLPYLAALIVASIAFAHGIKVQITVTALSVCVICLTPLMLTKRNRHLAKHYVRYFFARRRPGQTEDSETRNVIRMHTPLFQAAYFSGMVVCSGSAVSYVLFAHFGLDRDHRNLIVQAAMGLGSAWLAFSVCRYFERFCRDWAWVVLSVGLAQALDKRINPMCRVEVATVILLISFVLKSVLGRLMAVSLHFSASFMSPPLLGNDEAVGNLKADVESEIGITDDKGNEEEGSKVFSVGGDIATDRSRFEATSAAEDSDGSNMSSDADDELVDDADNDGIGSSRQFTSRVFKSIQVSSAVPAAQWNIADSIFRRTITKNNNSSSSINDNINNNTTHSTATIGEVSINGTLVCVLWSSADPALTATLKEAMAADGTLSDRLVHFQTFVTPPTNQQLVITMALTYDSFSTANAIYRIVSEDSNNRNSISNSSCGPASVPGSDNIFAICQAMQGIAAKDPYLRLLNHRITFGVVGRNLLVQFIVHHEPVMIAPIQRILDTVSEHFAVLVSSLMNHCHAPSGSSVGAIQTFDISLGSDSNSQGDPVRDLYLVHAQRDLIVKRSELASIRLRQLSAGEQFSVISGILAPLGVSVVDAVNGIDGRVQVEMEVVVTTAAPSRNNNDNNDSDSGEEDDVNGDDEVDVVTVRFQLTMPLAAVDNWKTSGVSCDSCLERYTAANLLACAMLSLYVYKAMVPLRFVEFPAADGQCEEGEGQTFA